MDTKASTAAAAANAATANNNRSHVVIQCDFGAGLPIHVSKTIIKVKGMISDNFKACGGVECLPDKVSSKLLLGEFDGENYEQVKDTVQKLFNKQNIRSVQPFVDTQHYYLVLVSDLMKLAPRYLSGFMDRPSSRLIALAPKEHTLSCITHYVFQGKLDELGHRYTFPIAVVSDDVDNDKIYQTLYSLVDNIDGLIALEHFNTPFLAPRRENVQRNYIMSQNKMDVKSLIVTKMVDDDASLSSLKPPPLSRRVEKQYSKLFEESFGSTTTPTPTQTPTTPTKVFVALTSEDNVEYFCRLRKDLRKDSSLDKKFGLKSELSYMPHVTQLMLLFWNRNDAQKFIREAPDNVSILDETDDEMTKSVINKAVVGNKNAFRVFGRNMLVKLIGTNVDLRRRLRNSIEEYLKREKISAYEFLDTERYEPHLTVAKYKDKITFDNRMLEGMVPKMFGEKTMIPLDKIMFGLVGAAAVATAAADAASSMDVDDDVGGDNDDDIAAEINSIYSLNSAQVESGILSMGTV